ncbi:MAG: hypothetical protein QOH49_1392 [Acidobacteriota bacterium]|jgi:amino acid adenylation domain-containing protein/FkbM family methyltransferase|nr:hypothetical protein [Acidobacteriota bacterium]
MLKEIIEGFRLSPQQEHVWRLQRDDERGNYRAQCEVRIEGRLDPRLLEESWRDVLARAEILRTTFHTPEGLTAPLQVVADSAEPSPLSVEDVRGLDESEQRRLVVRLLEEERALPFDFETGSSARLRLLRLSDDAHSLLVTLPALCADMVALDNLARELSESYEAFSHGRGVEDEAMQYAVFAEWQNELLASEDAEVGRQFWRDLDLQSFPALKLPFERQADGDEGFAPQSIGACLGQELAVKVESVCERYETTPQAFLLACWQVLLGRLSGESELLVLSACAGRSDEELERALGLFTRNLPTPCRLSAGETFAQLLEESGRALHAAEEWQECFSWETAGRPADADFAQLPAYFSFEFEPPVGSYAAGSVTFSVSNRYACVDRFKLKLSAAREADALRMDFHYDSNVFDHEYVTRLAAQFRKLVASAADAPEAPVESLDLLDTEERHRLLVEFNTTAVAYGRENLIHRLFEEQAARTPANVAIEFESQTLTYAELDEQSNRLANHLRSLGVGVESKVLVCMERSVEMVVALLGVLKAGGAYVPVDPSYPRARVEYILEDAKPAAVLTTEASADSVRDSGVQTVLLDCGSEEFAANSNARLESEVSPHNLAYVIYTSGSTGEPKGVMISHRSICNRLLWAQATHPLTEDDRLLQKTVFTFDASVWEFFVPLFVGACVVLARPDGHRDSAYLAEVIAEKQVTALQLVPTMLQVMLDEPGFKDCKSLRQVFCGGEALSLKTQERFFAMLDGADLRNLYGPTEVSIDATSWKCVRGNGHAGSHGGVPIGRPLSNMRVYILDSTLSPVPVGAPGELHVGGVGLARGYVNRPDLTAEKFIPDPFSTEPGARLYKTGDLARFLEDGNVEYLGRVDHQVKLRGFRIELGEVEAALRQHPSVGDAVAVVREDEPGRQSLVAYVTGAGRHTHERDGQQWYSLPDGLEIAHLNRNETDILYKEVFEDEFYLRNGVRLGDGACVFDVGANVGLFTLFVNDRCRDARVYAFEPIPVTHAALESNVRRYAPGSVAFNCGLSDRNGSATFTFYPKVSASSGMYADAREDEAVTRAFVTNQGEEMKAYADELMEGRFEGVQYECRLRTVSDVMREQGVERIDLLKVDVEKSEADVLRGIEEADWPKIKQVVLEVHDSHGRLEEITSLLKRHGFELVVEQYLDFENTGLYNVYAVHPSRSAGASAGEGDTAGLLPRGSDAGAPSAPELREFLGQKLPEYMVPSAIAVLEEFPTLPNGKVNRRALPPIAEAAEAAEPDASPRTPTEEIVSALWRKVMRSERVGLHDNFFDLGGHSLLATQVVSRLREAFQLELPLRSIFDSPTVAGLAAHIEATQKAMHGLQAPPMQAAPRDSDLPLSFAQQRLWFIDQLEPGSFYYNIPVALRLKGALDVSALVHTLDEVVRRHESLRTTFSEADGGPVQIIHPALPQSLKVVDLSGIGDAEQREGEARRLAGEEARQPFDLSTGPLLRASLLKLSDEEHVLLFTMHHIVSDGWSMGVLVREVSALYAAFAQGEESPLAELPVQYADYAAWQRNWLTGETLESQLSYWRGQLGGELTPLELPTDRPRPAVPSYKGARQVAALPKGLTDALKAISLEEGSTLFMTLLAAFNALMHHLSGRHDLVVGTDVANRNRAETEELIGFFINQLVLRTDLSGDPTFRELLGRVRAVSLGAYAHEDMPFDKLVDALKVERDVSRAPLFQVKLVLQNTPMGELELPGLTLSPLEAEGDKSNLDMTLFMRETEQGASATLEYSTDLFDATTAAHTLAQFASLLETIAARPDARLGELREVLARNDEEKRRAEKARLGESSFKKFKSFKPKAVSVTPAELVKSSTLEGGDLLPLVLEPNVADVDLIEWAAANRAEIETKLVRHGALLFRGFAIDPLGQFDGFARAVCEGLYNENGEHPRQSVKGDVYTPVFYPPEQKLLWHNENSFNHTWPGKILFCCARPAALGGETPLADSRRIFELLDARVRDRFLEKGVMYVRNYGTGLGLDWRAVFRASNRAEAEAKLRAAKVEFEWKDGDRLVTRCVRPAAVRHPRSGEPVWFNQAQHWHVSCLDPQTRESIAAVFREEDYPRNCYYGDGSPIEDSVMEEILDAYRKIEVVFPWRAGDILLLDNLLTAHARQPFTGERKLLVAMGEMRSFDEVDAPVQLVGA